jgi:hypothetical protein
MRISAQADGLVERAGFPTAIARDGDILRRIEHVCYIYVLTMEAFRPYVARLEELLGRSMSTERDGAFATDLDAALDGQPSAELRRRVSIDILRETGAFFTGSAMAKQAISAAGLRFSAHAKVLDPACGAGDLLVAMVDQLPCSSDLGSTLRDWGRQVLALDLQPDFVRATKLRLALAAIRRQFPAYRKKLPSLDELFPGVGLGSSLVEEDIYRQATHILINPPFTPVDAPETCAWGSGRVNSAAVFMDACVSGSEPDTHIIAILPDVLRSGSNYAKWRQLLEDRVALKTIQIIGRFDRHTDVDVFVLVGKIRKKLASTPKFNWIPSEQNGGLRVSDKFDVSVGAVVSYRDPHEGAWFPFIQARDLPSWEAVSAFCHHRRFNGKTFRPPFVAVRRTSRPGDKNRAVGTIIRGRGRIAVENHLLVLRPKDRTLKSCYELLAILKDERSNQFLDRRIRCRHLTVSALTDLPWGDR